MGPFHITEIESDKEVNPLEYWNYERRVAAQPMDYPPFGENMQLEQNKTMELQLMRDTTDLLEGAVTANSTSLRWLISKLRTFKLREHEGINSAESQLTEIFTSSVEERHRLSCTLKEMDAREVIEVCEDKRAFEIRVNTVKKIKSEQNYAAETSGAGMAQASVIPNLTVTERHIKRLCLPIDASHYISHEMVLPVLFGSTAERPISCNIMAKFCSILGISEEAGAVESSILTKPTYINSCLGEWNSSLNPVKNPPSLGTSLTNIIPYVVSPFIGESAKVIMQEADFNANYATLDMDVTCDNINHESRGMNAMQHGIYLPATWLRYAYTYCYQCEWADVGMLNHAEIRNDSQVYLPIGNTEDGEQETALKVEAILIANSLVNCQREHEEHTGEKVRLGDLDANKMWPLVGMKPESIRLLISSMKPNETGRNKKIDDTVLTTKVVQVMSMQHDDKVAFAITILCDVARELQKNDNGLSRLFQRHLLSALYVLALAHKLAISKPFVDQNEVIQSFFGVINTSFETKISEIVGVATGTNTTLQSRTLFCSLQALVIEVCNRSIISEAELSSKRLSVPLVRCSPWAHLCRCCELPTNELATVIISNTKKSNDCAQVTIDKIKASFCYKDVTKHTKKHVENMQLVAATIDIYALLWEESFYVENKMSESSCRFQGHHIRDNNSIVWSWENFTKMLSMAIIQNWRKIRTTTFANAIIRDNDIEWDTLKPTIESALSIANAVLLGCIIRGTAEVPSKSFESTLAYLTRYNNHKELHDGCRMSVVCSFT